MTAFWDLVFTTSCRSPSQARNISDNAEDGSPVLREVNVSERFTILSHSCYFPEGPQADGFAAKSIPPYPSHRGPESRESVAPERQRWKLQMGIYLLAFCIEASVRGCIPFSALRNPLTVVKEWAIHSSSGEFAIPILLEKSRIYSR